ncbi:MAG TPA: wax ester/triacylglycerol synthase domain-containing protein [Acidimicrobiales bacterium]|nr:wax ester/triacylglycerol synthase domain-containing protein [Acidimicrobiales bacterium]
MADHRLRFETKMSEQEALMWALEQDPVLRSSFSNVTFFDRPPDVARFRSRMERAIQVLPRLRQRVSEPAGGLSSPSWVDDSLFDLDFHVRHIAVPPPGTEDQVLQLGALLSGDAFDRARPLWQFTIVEGLEGGRGAMLQRMHHTITDGEGGIRLSAMFTDIDRDATEPLGGSSAVVAAQVEGRSAMTTVRETVGDAVRGPLGVARRAVGQVGHIVTDPRGGADDAVETARSVLRQLAVTEPSHSPLWSQRSLRRHLEVLSIPLDEAKEAAHALDGTVNDLFVTGAVGGAGAYHRALGSEVDELRMAMPVSTRTDKGAGGNAFAPTRMLVPAGIVDPRERFAAVQAVLAAAKGERASGVTAQLAGLINVLPTPVITKVARQQVGTVDFTTSNVRGAPFDLFIAGARIEANYPIGPMAGTAFNLTTMSYCGRLDMGCAIDLAAIDDPALLRQCLVDAYDELLALRH